MRQVLDDFATFTDCFDDLPIFSVAFRNNVIGAPSINEDWKNTVIYKECLKTNQI